MKQLAENKTSDNKINFAILGIVAIVGIVAVVTLFGGNRGSSMMVVPSGGAGEQMMDDINPDMMVSEDFVAGETGDLAGEAYSSVWCRNMKAAIPQIQQAYQYHVSQCMKDVKKYRSQCDAATDKAKWLNLAIPDVRNSCDNK